MIPKEPRRTLAVTRQALPRGAATARAQVRDTRVPPTLVHRQEPPGLGHTRCRVLLGQAQNRARARAAWVTPYLSPYPPRPPRMARVDCGVVGEIVGGFFIRKGGTSAPSLLISRGNMVSSPIRPLLFQSRKSLPLPFFPKPKESSALPPIATSTTNVV